MVLLIILGIFILYKYLVEEDSRKKKALIIVLIVDIIAIFMLSGAIVGFTFLIKSLFFYSKAW